MSKFCHVNHGTCSRRVEFELAPDHTVSRIRFEGGCNGNLQGICSLCDGQKAEDLICKLDGIKCGTKSTSCPDQLADALKEALQNLK